MHMCNRRKDSISYCQNAQVGCMEKHCKPWRTHKSDPKINQTTIPDAMVSIDQIESLTPGFTLIGKGQPTLRHYCRATVFVDHASDFTYVHMNEALMTAELKQIAEQHGVKIQHYHCDNGHFADCAFVTDLHKAQQTIKFHGVGAHHQSGFTERCTQYITESTRTMLLHVRHLWPKTITANLWPQAMKHATNC